MDPMLLTNGEAQRIRETIGDHRKRLETLKPSGDDAPAMLFRKCQAVMQEAEAAFGTAEVVLNATEQALHEAEQRSKQTDGACQLATFSRLLDLGDGTRRARVNLAGATFHVVVDDDVDPEELKAGVLVELSLENKRLVGVADIPQGGELLTVTAVPPDSVNGRERFIEVEEPGDRRLLVQAARGLDLAGLEPGARVRVWQGFAYEAVSGTAARSFKDRKSVV